MSQRMRTALDFGPLLAYIVTFYVTGKDVYIATGVVMIASVISLGIYYAQTRKIAPIPAFTCFIMLTFGGLTIYFHNDAFIMMKPTIVYVFMGTGLIASAMTGKNVLGKAMGPYMKMAPEGWKKFLTRFGVFCFFAAGINEVLRQVVSFEVWLNFKLFGFTTLFFVFSMSQAPLLAKYMEIDEEEAEADPVES